MRKKRKSKGRNSINPINVILGLAVVILFIYLIYKGLTSIKSRNYATTSSPSPTPDVTADWKNYININPEYSIKYPPNFLLSGCPSCSKSLKDLKYIVISDPNDDGKKAGLGVIKITQINSDFEKIKSLEKYSNGFLDGYTETIKSGKYITKYVYFVNNASTIGLIFSGLGNIDGKYIPVEQFVNYGIFNRILTTFKFNADQSIVVSATPIATFIPQLGTNRDYSDPNISFKYPGDWLQEQGNSKYPSLPENTITLVNDRIKSNIFVISAKSSSDPRTALKDFVDKTFRITNTEVISSDNKIAKGYFTQSVGSSNAKINIVYLTKGDSAVVLTTDLPSDKLNIFYGIIDSLKFN